MRHFVLTRSAYGPDWDPEANRRRLAVTKAVTARLMAAQTTRAWTWVVLLDPRDPLLAERTDVYAAAAPELRTILWSPPDIDRLLPWDRHRDRRTVAVQRIAASAYHAPWRDVVGRGELALQTRLDDDDGLAPDALERYQHASRTSHRRTILMLPRGVRVWAGRYSDVRHARNAMHTLVTPPGDPGSVYDYGHAVCHRTAPIRLVDETWGWLWVRHQDTISGWKRADLPVDSRVRRAFPIDWSVLGL